MIQLFLPLKMQTYQELKKKLESIDDERADALLAEVSSYDPEEYEEVNKKLLKIDDLDFYFKYDVPRILRKPKSDLISKLRGDCVGEHLYSLTYSELLYLVSKWNQISKEMLKDYEKKTGKTICPSSQKELEDIIEPIWQEERDDASKEIMDGLYKLKMEPLVKFYSKYNFVCKMEIASEWTGKLKEFEAMVTYLQSGVIATDEISRIKLPHKDKLECVKIEQLNERLKTLRTCETLYSALNGIDRYYLEHKHPSIMTNGDYIKMFEHAAYFHVALIVIVIIIVVAAIVTFFTVRRRRSSKQENVAKL